MTVSSKKPVIYNKEYIYMWSSKGHKEDQWMEVVTQNKEYSNSTFQWDISSLVLSYIVSLKMCFKNPTLESQAITQNNVKKGFHSQKVLKSYKYDSYNISFLKKSKKSLSSSTSLVGRQFPPLPGLDQELRTWASPFPFFLKIMPTLHHTPPPRAPNLTNF